MTGNRAGHVQFELIESHILPLQSQQFAEQYGVLDAAEKMYSRVEKPKMDYPGTSYVIAQQHLTMLRGSANNSAKAVGQ